MKVFLNEDRWYYYFILRLRRAVSGAPHICTRIDMSDLPLIDHNSIVIQRELSRITFSFRQQPKVDHFFKDKSLIKWSKRRSFYRRWFLRISYGNGNRHTYIRIQLAYKRGSYILIIFVLFLLFSSLSLLLFFSLFRSRLLYYFVIGLRGCFFLSFFYFFFIPSCPPFTLFARFFSPFFFFVSLFSRRTFCY